MNEPAIVIQQPARAMQLIVLLHGVGSHAAAMQPLGLAFARTFPQAFVVALDAPHPFDAAMIDGRQWFSVKDVSEENRPQRVFDALPALETTVRAWQQRSGVSTEGTALVGFSQGAIMALAAAAQPEPVASRIIAIAGRFASLPEEPLHENTTVHLLHGKEDPVMPYRHAIEGALRLKSLGADFTAHVLPFIGHELHPDLVELAVEQLEQHIPGRLWLQPGEGGTA